MGRPDLILGDPNKINNNGRLFKEFLLRHPNLKVVNSLSSCQGLITRRCQTVNKLEDSVIDFFVVCDRVYNFIDKMIIDEDRKYCLTNYHRRKGKKGPIESDHNPMILYLNVAYSKMIQERVEMYNLKNLDGQKLFNEITSVTNNLSNCFGNGKPLNEQIKAWEQTFAISQSFKKIRITNYKKLSVSDQLMNERQQLRGRLKIETDSQSLEQIRTLIQSVEDKLSNLMAEENVKKVRDNLSSLSNTDGTMAVSGIWKIKKKIFPKHSKSLPVSKKGPGGRLVSSPEELKELNLSTYKHRLRHRPMKPEFEQLKNWKEELCFKRLKLVKSMQFEPWTNQDLEKVLISLKNNKSRDPYSLINEIFKPGVIGSDLQSSLLLMLNRIKAEFSIPELMELVNIISIYKGKGEKNDLQSDRGIFILNIIRSIMMKLIYNQEYETIDSNMSDSNIGARKDKNIRNHIFILNGIINEAIKSKKKAVDIQILDYRQCFDSMWLEECINDLYDSGVQNPNLALIYEANGKWQL